MANVSVTQKLPVAPEEAWNILSNLSHWEQWLSIHQAWKSALPAEVTEGMQVTEVVSVMGMAKKIEWTATKVDAPNSITIEGTGMAGVKIELTMSVKPEGDGSEAQIDASFTGAMIVGPIGKSIAKNTQADLEKSLTTFAELVEQGKLSA